jgi:hypothetical protein
MTFLQNILHIKQPRGDILNVPFLSQYATLGVHRVGNSINFFSIPIINRRARARGTTSNQNA